MDKLGDAAEQDYTSCYCEENCVKLAQKLVALSGGDASACPAAVVFISNAEAKTPVWHQRAAADEDTPVVWDYHVIVAAADATGGAVVLDLDTLLTPWPCPAETYITAAFRPHMQLRQQYQHYFRVVPVHQLLLHFSSDRRHMRKSAPAAATKEMEAAEHSAEDSEEETAEADSGAATGAAQGASVDDSNGSGAAATISGPGAADADLWLSPPPSWPCIRGPAAATAHTLAQYLDFSPAAQAAVTTVDSPYGAIVSLANLPPVLNQLLLPHAR